MGIFVKASSKIVRMACDTISSQQLGQMLDNRSMGATDAAVAAHIGNHHSPAAGVTKAPLQQGRQNFGKRKHGTVGSQSCESPMKKIYPLYNDNINTSKAAGCVDFAPEQDLYGASHANGIRFTGVDSGADDEFGNFDFDVDELDVEFLVQPGGGTIQFAEDPSVDEDFFSQLVCLSPAPEPKQPPSSVLREYRDVFNTVSSSTTSSRFDPTLQYSPPLPHPVSSPVEEKPDHEANILNDMSWDNLESQLDEFSPDQTCNSKIEDGCESEIMNTRMLTQQTTPPSTASSVPPGLVLRPYKTWFHIREMLEAKKTMYRNQHNAIFELFARVVYTCRENFERKQLFQLRDLFKISPPYLPGVLLN